MDIHFLGAAREVGRSAVLLKTDVSVLLDYGVKMIGEDRYPERFSDRVDAVLLSHAHLDHSGYIPALYQYSKPSFYSTPPTMEIASVLFNDSIKLSNGEIYKKKDVEKAKKNWLPMIYRQELRMGQTRFRWYDAGHILGSSMIEAEFQGKKLLYTGDIKDEQMQLHNGYSYKGECDYLLIESTYSYKDHPPRKEVEKALAELVREYLEKGFPVIFPAFAVGRAQELIMIMHEHLPEAKVYVDGMAKDVSAIYMRYPEYLSKGVEFAKAYRSTKPVKSNADRERALKGANVIVTTAGLLEGGPVLGYIERAPKNAAIVLTGFPIPGTNASLLLENSTLQMEEGLMKVDQAVRYMDLSAHIGKEGLLKLINSTNPEKIFLMHGDHCDEFAAELKEEGWDAIAPKVGERYNL
ncbi:MAG: MBL fold metallo-hydrolase [Candidatus Anstonellales archaeon]